MEAALKGDQFKLYFQPKVDIQNGNRIHGAEVLARWHDGDRLVPPCDFIPLFERNGFIIQLDRYMFSRACAWLQRRIREGRPTLNIAVNVSRLSLMQELLQQHQGALRYPRRPAGAGMYGIPGPVRRAFPGDGAGVAEARFPLFLG